MTAPDLTPEQMESLKRGIADALAGRVTPLSDVLAAMGVEAFEAQMDETRDEPKENQT